jgi:cell division protein FtsB
VKRIGRYILNGLAVLSLLLCVTSAVVGINGKLRMRE